MTANIIRPDADAAKRLADRLVAALSAVPTVCVLAIFGSLAENTADCWSDVDLWVACDTTDDIWTAADALRRDLPIEFYRMFTGVVQPSGRYWFSDASPFQKADISFHSCNEYQRLAEKPMMREHPVTLRELYRRPVKAMEPGPVVSPFSLPITAEETEIGKWVYRLSLSAKARARGKPDGIYLEEDIAGLREVFAARQPDYCTGGRQLGRLVSRMLAFAEYLCEQYPLERTP